MNVKTNIARLIAFRSVVSTTDGAIVDGIYDCSQAAGAEVTVLPGPEGNWSNLSVTVSPREARGDIISGHTSIVPAGEPDWSSDPLALCRDGGLLNCHGGIEMKGFLTGALAALPVHIEISEPAACRKKIERLGAGLAA